MKTAFRILLATAAFALLPLPSQAGVFISVSIAPPPLPVYVQPPCPEPGYIWIPGYWAWDPDFGDYYWVPGTWVLAPEPGFYWTPGWWGWEDAVYVWHPGYWGPRVGFYGGIDYGYGYPGHGYVGGMWERGVFRYNTAVNNVDVHVIHNTYHTTVVNNINVTRVSYNGGHGVEARPTRVEREAEHERHIGHTDWQSEHERAARNDRELFASRNHGLPGIAATTKPGDFHDRGAVPASVGGNWRGVPQPQAKPGDEGNRNIGESWPRPRRETAPERNTERPRMHTLPPREEGRPDIQRRNRNDHGEARSGAPTVQPSSPWHREPPAMDEKPRPRRDEQPHFEEPARPQTFRSRPRVSENPPARESGGPRYESAPRAMEPQRGGGPRAEPGGSPRPVERGADSRGQTRGENRGPERKPHEER